MGKFALRPLNLTFSSYIHGFLYPWDNPIIFFWFLPTIFFILIISFSYLKYFSKNINYLLIFSIFISLLFDKFINIRFLNINGILNYTFFFVLGIFYHEKEKKYDKIILNSKIIFLLSFIFLLINCMFELPQNKLIYIFISITGIIFSITLFGFYTQYNLKFLEHLSGKSFSIYLFSWFPQVFIRILGFQVLKLSWEIVLPFSFIFGVYIPYIINIVSKLIINKYSKLKFLKFITGI